MRESATGSLTDALRAAAVPLAGDARDYDALLALIGDARFVLIGEASHGTQEFYRERAAITKRLIAERGFTAVASRATGPTRTRSIATRAAPATRRTRTRRSAASDVSRPGCNTVVREFVSWLLAYNDARGPREAMAGFYGLDLYSLYRSIEAVLGYLDRVDPEAARRARERYRCFEDFRQDSQAYGYATGLGGAEPCEGDVLQQLVELRRHAADYAHRDGRIAEDEYFYAEQNARLVKNAEEYYRAMFRGRVSSWNLRDRHMVETLGALVDHLDQYVGQNRAKVVVWAHNSHLGDARATELGESGELNVGQLVRERWGRETILISFSTYTGTVTAAGDWDEPAQRKRVRPGLPNSYEALFHATTLPRFLLPLRANDELPADLHTPRLQRAIGVIYRPETERYSHYFYARLPEQFDAVVHLDETHALAPLERTAGWETGEAPETYPTTV
jgi:erythromycin esterase-like protein